MLQTCSVEHSKGANAHQGQLRYPRIGSKRNVHVTKFGTRSCDPFQEDCTRLGTLDPEAFLVVESHTGKESNVVESIRCSWHQQSESKVTQFPRSKVETVHSRHREMVSVLRDRWRFHCRLGCALRMS